MFEKVDKARISKESLGNNEEVIKSYVEKSYPQEGALTMWIDNASQVDILFYEPYADVIADIAQNPDYKPLTIGVFGIWGAGKSTLLNLIEQKIMNSNEDRKNICVKINAWTFEGYEDAKVAIIECLLRELNEKDPTGLGKKILNLLKRLDYFKLSTKAIGISAPIVAGLATGNPLLAILGITGTSTEIGDGIKELSEAVQTLHDDYFEKEEPPCNETLVNNIRKFRYEFEKELMQSNIENIIVLIDDLDRCQPDRIIETLEAIKLFLSVIKTVFIIAADENVIQYAIKKKYPPLGNFAVNFDKEYTEKIIQLPIYIPELSSKDIENYLMLLVAQEYCSNDNFKKLITKLRSSKIRISEDIIDFSKLNELVNDYISPDKKTDFSETAKIISGIKGLISGNLKGNPRQAKRFLNTFMTKRKLAELYYTKSEIDLTVLAKLLVLQKLDPNLFMELHEWNKHYSTINEEFQKMRTYLANEEDSENADNQFKAWRTPSIRKWVESKPVNIESIRLDRYFYLTRENLQKVEIDTSALSNAAKDVLAKIGNSTSGTVLTIVNNMKKLSSTDLNNVFKVLLPKISEAKIDLYLISEIFIAFKEYRESIISVMHNYTGKIAMRSLPSIKKMRKTDQIKIDNLLNFWKQRGIVNDNILEEIRVRRRT